MIIIHYDAIHGVAIPDGIIADYVTDLIDLHKEWSNVVRSISSSTVIEEFRLRVVREEFSHTELQFVFEDQTLTLNEYAVLPDWPKGFADLSDRQVTEILMSTIKRRRSTQQKEEAQ